MTLDQVDKYVLNKKIHTVSDTDDSDLVADSLLYIGLLNID